MKAKRVLLPANKSQYFGAAILFSLLTVLVVLFPHNATGQQPALPKLTLSQVEQLVSHGVPDLTLSAQVHRRGLAFTPTLANLEELRIKGAGPLTLAALEAHLPAKPISPLGVPGQAAARPVPESSRTDEVSAKTNRSEVHLKGSIKRYSDQIKLISVETESGYSVERGKPVAMKVTLAYTLASRDKAILTLSTAQFRGTGHCPVDGDAELVDAVEREVQNGSGTITIHIVWSGDTGEKSEGRINGHGGLSFMAMFWKDIGGGRGTRDQMERFGLFPLYQDYCAAF
jgi:hypothetical protein